MSNLNVPSFQLWSAAVFSIFNEIALALARVSTLVVDEVISNGPSDELDLESFGNFLSLM